MTRSLVDAQEAAFPSSLIVYDPTHDPSPEPFDNIAIKRSEAVVLHGHLNGTCSG